MPGWLPLIAWLVIGVPLGFAARRMGPARRRAVYATPAVLLTVTVALMSASPPCEDLLDGPCEHSWVSEGAALGVILFVPLAIAAFVCAMTTRRKRQKLPHR